MMQRLDRGEKAITKVARVGSEIQRLLDSEWLKIQRLENEWMKIQRLDSEWLKIQRLDSEWMKIQRLESE